MSRAVALHLAPEAARATAPWLLSLALIVSVRPSVRPSQLEGFYLNFFHTNIRGTSFLFFLTCVQLIEASRPAVSCRTESIFMNGIQ